MDESKDGVRRVALVTGGGHGIGAAIARRLARDGVAVVVNHSRGGEEASALVAEVGAAGGTSVAVQGDVTKPDQVAAMFAEIDRRFGRLDILVNNAGVADMAPLASITEEQIDRVFAVNVKGVIFVSQEAAKRLGPGGRIVNISSSTADFPMPGLSVYASSKAVPKLLTEVWAQELAAQGVTVNSVLPGATSPGMFDRAPPQLREQVAHASPFHRLGSADEVAEVVAFLCSDAARWVSGQHIRVNGGARA